MNLCTHSPGLAISRFRRIRPIFELFLYASIRNTAVAHEAAEGCNCVGCDDCGLCAQCAGLLLQLANEGPLKSRPSGSAAIDAGRLDQERRRREPPRSNL